MGVRGGRAGGRQRRVCADPGGGGGRGRGLTGVVAPQSVVGARQWYWRATAVADARALQVESSHLLPQRFGFIYCAPVTHVISCGLL